MCTTIGFSYENGNVFGRTLELGMILDNKILFVPKGKEIITTLENNCKTKYNTLGSGFFDIASFGDGINEMGLMGSSNFFPGYASFATNPSDGMVNTTTSNAFDYLLTRCEDVNEVREETKKILLLKTIGKQKSSANRSFFMESKGSKVVLEPKAGKLLTYENPYGVLTNAPRYSPLLRKYCHPVKDSPINFLLLYHIGTFIPAFEIIMCRRLTIILYNDCDIL